MGRWSVERFAGPERAPGIQTADLKVEEGKQAGRHEKKGAGEDRLLDTQKRVA